MRILFLLFAIFLLVLQTVPGNADPAPDTMECKLSRGFCKYASCPGTTVPTGGTCQWGTLVCCKSPWRNWENYRWNKISGFLEKFLPASSETRMKKFFKDFKCCWKVVNGMPLFTILLFQFYLHLMHTYTFAPWRNVITSSYSASTALQLTQL